MEIKVLCPGCSGCERLARSIEEEARAMGLGVEVENVVEASKIRRYTDKTPAIVVDGQLRHGGRPTPAVERIREILKGQ